MTKLEYINRPRTWGTSDNIAVIGRDDVKVWFGTLTLFSGTPHEGSGYMYDSGESNVKPIDQTGAGEIRIPDLSVVHQVQLTPRNPRFKCAPNHTASGVDPYCMSGRPYNVVKVHWLDVTSGATTLFDCSGAISGEIDAIAVGN